MKVLKKSALIFLILLVSLVAYSNTLTPFSKLLRSKPGSVQSSSWTRVPVITWGADITTIYANGNSAKTQSGSIFRNSGLNIELYREDDFQKQVEAYLSGETPFLRGTMGMINMAADVASNDKRTKPVVIYQHSWSAGGDALVVKSGINNIGDLRGKTIAIQKYGPHVDYLMKLLSDAGLSINDVKVKWTKDFVGPDDDTPMAQLYESGIHAAFVIIPDALALTSNGTVGTGSEDSVKGARILLSTKTANRIITDVYAVRKDYYDSNRRDVENFVKALFKAEEEVKDLFKNKSNANYKKMLSGAAKILLDSSQATGDTEALFYDAEMAGYNGNVKFFTDSKNRRNFEVINKEIQASFKSLGLLTGPKEILKAGWSYNNMAGGLKYANQAEAPKFDQDEVSTIINKRQKINTTDDDSLFSFMIFFQPNQNEFTADMYRSEFDKVIDYSATYGGAIITVEGHSDPMGYLRKKGKGESEAVLSRIKQAAKNLSLSRANKVRDEIVNYASKNGITLDTSQFAVVGHGIVRPINNKPQTKEQWLENMRVEFKIIQVEAEEDVFVPLDF